MCRRTSAKVQLKIQFPLRATCSFASLTCSLSELCAKEQNVFTEHETITQASSQMSGRQCCNYVNTVRSNAVLSSTTYFL